MTNELSVKVISHNFNGMPIFLAKLTQRGHKINTMDDLMDLYKTCINKTPSKDLMLLPHSTIKRMCYLTVAIVGLSTKAVSQLRTHAKRLTFVSTSTQYSSYEKCDNAYVLPDGLEDNEAEAFKNAYDLVHKAYANLIEQNIDKDKASYLLPQGLKKALIVSGNLDDWEYVLKTRLCHRNTLEVQEVCKLIYKEIKACCGEAYTINMLPNCVNDKCKEGKFCCNKKFSEGELE